MGLEDAAFAIVGLGLMGGSLGMALKARGLGRRVRGVARRTESVEQAVALDAVDEGTLDLAEGVAGADVVILATPVRTIIRQVGEIGPYLDPGCLLMDLGSTKGAIVEAMADLPQAVQPLGGHPMCGKEVSGIEAADADLYEAATFVLTPLERTAPDALSTAEEMAAALGAQPLVMGSERHDRLVAVTSHLPYLAASGLVAAAGEVGGQDERIWSLVAGGFQDTTRLAASDVTMMLDILMTNRESLERQVQAFRRLLAGLSYRLRVGDEEGLRQMLASVHERRAEMT